MQVVGYDKEEKEGFTRSYKDRNSLPKGVGGA